MTWNQKKYIDCSERPNGLSLKDNSFLTKFTSHLEVSGFYHQQLPIVYLDLYFCLSGPWWSRCLCGYLCSHLLINKLLPTEAWSSQFYFQPQQPGQAKDQRWWSYQLSISRATKSRFQKFYYGLNFVYWANIFEVNNHWLFKSLWTLW